MRVLFLAKYGRRAASTRYRFSQYFPLLARAGIECVLAPLFDDRYLAARLDDGRLDPAAIARGVVSRLAVLARVRRFDLVVVHMEAFPYLPALYERVLAALGVPYVYDFDDASFHQYDQHRSPLVRSLLGGKIDAVIRRAALVVAGNDYLAAYAKRTNPRVHVVPTVVDMTQYQPAPVHAEGPVVIGWMGSPSTGAYVVERAAIWARITREHDCVLRLVGAGRVALDPARYELVPWTEAREVADLQGFDVGVMPLRDDPWARGKCGFKLIQYMACGLPVVASPVGVNQRIVTDGETGFLCASDEEWEARLARLVSDATLRRRMGAAAREVAARDWSLQRWGPTWVGLLAEAARR